MLDLGLRFRDLDLGFWVQGFWFWGLGFLDLGFRDLG